MTGGWQMRPSLQEEHKGESRELEAYQSDLGTRKCHGADCLECHHMAHMGQTNDQKQPACVFKRQVLPN